MNIEELTNQKNIKLTSARKVILKTLINADKPLCYEDMKNELLMDKATFYRNITKFEEENIINSFESNDKKRYYEIKKAKHSHFICTNCSLIECIHEDIDLNLKNYQIDNIIIKGICPKCLKKKEKIND